MFLNIFIKLFQLEKTFGSKKSIQIPISSETAKQNQEAWVASHHVFYLKQNRMEFILVPFVF